MSDVTVASVLPLGKNLPFVSVEGGRASYLGSVEGGASYLRLIYTMFSLFSLCFSEH